MFNMKVRNRAIALSFHLFWVLYTYFCKECTFVKNKCNVWHIVNKKKNIFYVVTLLSRNCTAILFATPRVNLKIFVTIECLNNNKF